MAARPGSSAAWQKRMAEAALPCTQCVFAISTNSVARAVPPYCYAILAQRSTRATPPHALTITLACPRSSAWPSRYDHAWSCRQRAGWRSGEVPESAWDVPANWSLPEKAAGAATAARTMARRSSPRADVRRLANNYEITASSIPTIPSGTGILYLLTRRRGANAAHTQMRRPTH